MIALRLFSASDTSRQLDMRTIGDGESLTVGRDASAAWPLSDPDRALSRLHLTIAVQGGSVIATDTSTNGVMFSQREERLPRDRPVPVTAGEGLRLGPYLILVEHTDTAGPSVSSPSRSAASPFEPLNRDDFRAPIQKRADPFSSALPSDPLNANPAHSEAPLFERGEPNDSALHLGDDDDWSSKSDRKVGDWNAPAVVRDPGEMIGSSPSWREPPAVEKEEAGFGFDTPFRSPILSEPVISASDIAIPSDWDNSGVAANNHAIAPESEIIPALEPSTPILAPTAAPEIPGPPISPFPKTAFPVEAELEVAPEPDPFATALAEASEPDPFAMPSLEAPEPTSRAMPPSEEPEPALFAMPPPEQPNDDRLVQAFCAGAHLDPAIFGREDSIAIVERLGGVYRQMVLGLSDVMGERTALRNEYRMVRTTVQAQDNNPFKWAPPQKVAAELLLTTNEGFMTGPDAVTDSFQDIKKHLLCMLAGLRAALSSTLESLDPARIENALKDQPFALKTRAASAWGEYARVYAQLRHDVEDDADSPVNREFRAAYEKQLAELDRMSLR